MTGVQVHHRGGHQCDLQGRLRPPPGEYPALRCTRTLAENMVVTVEPDAMDWSLVDKLMPFGGVRIEDNVLVSDRQPRNLTREAFAALGA